jgi:hypothetical protein
MQKKASQLPKILRGYAFAALLLATIFLMSNIPALARVETSSDGAGGGTALTLLAFSMMALGAGNVLRYMGRALWRTCRATR